MNNLVTYYSAFSVSTLQKSKEFYLAEIEDLLESHSVLKPQQAVIDNMTKRLTAIQSVIESKLNNAN